MAAVLAVILQPSESSSGKLPILWQRNRLPITVFSPEFRQTYLLPQYGSQI
jgi:hypothetical protein